MSKEMVKLTGLWKAKDAQGKSYLTGTLNQITKLMVLPNTYKKEGEKAPDYFLFVAKHEKNTETPQDTKDSL